MWFSEQDIANAWNNTKSFVGQAWHHGKHVLGTIDRFANISQRLLSAAAASGLKGRALEAGVRAADSYNQVRNRAQRFDRDVQDTVSRFRMAAPELNI